MTDYKARSLKRYGKKKKNNNNPNEITKQTAVVYLVANTSSQKIWSQVISIWTKSTSEKRNAYLYFLILYNGYIFLYHSYPKK